MIKSKSPALATLNSPLVLIACATGKERERWRRALEEKFTVVEVDARSSPKRLLAKLKSPVVLLDLDAQKSDASNALAAIARLNQVAEAIPIPLTQGDHKIKLGSSADLVPRLLEGVAPLHEHPREDRGNLLALLSRRKREIARLIATGASNKEIANDLHISEATVKAQLTHIFRILHLSGRVQLAVFLTKH